MKTIKEIAPYLPYNLGIKILNHKSDYIGIEYSTINGFYYVNDIPHFEYKGGGTGKSFDDCKFIMRPLSDLTKPCLEDSKIPIVELAKISEGKHFSSEFIINENVARGYYLITYKETSSEDLFIFSYTHEQKGFYLNCDNKIRRVMVENQFQLFQKLFEWHFW